MNSSSLAVFGIRVRSSSSGRFSFERSVGVYLVGMMARKGAILFIQAKREGKCLNLNDHQPRMDKRLPTLPTKCIMTLYKLRGKNTNCWVQMTKRESEPDRCKLVHCEIISRAAKVHAPDGFVHIPRLSSHPISNYNGRHRPVTTYNFRGVLTHDL